MTSPLQGQLAAGPKTETPDSLQFLQNSTKNKIFLEVLDMAPWTGLEVLKLDTLLFCLRKKGKSRVENSIAVVGVTKALLVGNSSLNLTPTNKRFQRL